MSVGGPVLTVRLGFWVRAFCRVQSKLSILSCMKPQIFSSSKRQVLSVGMGREGAAKLLLFKHPPQAAWALAAVLCHYWGSVSSWGQMGSPQPQEEAAKEGITEIIEITEWVELEAASKTIQFQTHCHGRGCHSLDQVSQSPIQPDLGRFHRWGTHNISRQPVPVPCHSLSKEFTLKI